MDSLKTITNNLFMFTNNVKIKKAPFFRKALEDVV